jgi:hypothetical protein
MILVIKDILNKKMTTKFKIYVSVFYSAILIPFVTIIFFIRTSSLLIILPILFLSFITLIISTIGVKKADSNNPQKRNYWKISISAILIFLFSYSFQILVADWLFFKFREDKLTLFISELKKYGKIKEMSDGQRYWKTINNISIEPSLTKTDTCSEFGKKYYLDDILKREEIDKQHYDFFKNILIETNLTGFEILGDETISFTIDGFLDNCYGIAYSETGDNPCANYCGRIITWNQIGHNWYAWSTT